MVSIVISFDFIIKFAVSLPLSSIYTKTVKPGMGRAATLQNLPYCTFLYNPMDDLQARVTPRNGKNTHQRENETENHVRKIM
jgi:hypothetical protein